MRVPIPDDVAARVLFESNHTCCVCQRAGEFVQVHHIDEDHANSLDPENLAVLCVPCHIKTQLSGGFVRHLGPAEVKMYRDEWVVRVRERKALSDRMAAESMASVPKDISVSDSLSVSVAEGVGISDGRAVAVAVGEAALSIEGQRPQVVVRPEPLAFVRSLIQLRRRAYLLARNDWDTGTTADTLNATHAVISTMQTALVTLSAYLPEGRLGGQDANEYFSELIASRFRWRRLTQSEGGTMGEQATVGEVLSDTEAMVVHMVRSLARQELVTIDFDSWRSDWNEATE